MWRHLYQHEEDLQNAAGVRMLIRVSQLILSTLLLLFASPVEARRLSECDILGNVANDHVGSRSFLNTESGSAPTDRGDAILALKFLAIAPPSKDAETLPKLCLAARDTQKPLARCIAAIGLGNVAAIDDDELYRRRGGHGTTLAIRKQAIECLLPLLTDEYSDVISEAATSLGKMYPTDPKALESLASVLNPNRQYGQFRFGTGEEGFPPGYAGIAIGTLSGAARDRDLVDWLPSIRTAREAVKAAAIKDSENNANFYGPLIIRIDGAIAGLERKLWLNRLAYGASALVVFHAFIFTILILVARWKQWAFELLFDPLWAKAATYFYPFLRYYWPLQRWLLERYYTERRLQIVESPRLYSSAILTGPSGAIGSSSILSHWRSSKRIWICGASGMGKTALTSALDRQFFLNPSSRRLADALAGTGAMPIIIAARDYESIAVSSSHPENWVLVAVQHTLQAGGVRIDDLGILRSMLQGGHLAIIIDGANEVDRNDAIARFANINRKTPIIVTSQGMPPATAEALFEIWNMPSSSEAYVEELFRLYLGSTRGAAVAAAAKAAGLIGDIKSGYEAMLIIDLAKRDDEFSLPSDRIALYQAFLTPLRLGASTYPIGDIELLSWSMIGASGKRRFSDGELSKDLIYPLLAAECRLVLEASKGQYEFRHDQMRAYLASRHLCKMTVAGLQSELSESNVWKRTEDEQDTLWGFFAEIQTDRSRCEELWRFAAEARIRGSLQEALQEKAKRNTWEFRLIMTHPNSSVH